MKYIFCIVAACISSTYILAMEEKQNLLANQCKKTTFGTDRQTVFDKQLKKEIKRVQQENPEKYNRLTQAASRDTHGTK